MMPRVSPFPHGFRPDWFSSLWPEWSGHRLIEYRWRVNMSAKKRHAKYQDRIVLLSNGSISICPHPIAWIAFTPHNSVLRRSSQSQMQSGFSYFCAFVAQCFLETTQRFSFGEETIKSKPKNECFACKFVGQIIKIKEIHWPKNSLKDENQSLQTGSGADADGVGSRCRRGWSRCGRGREQMRTGSGADADGVAGRKQTPGQKQQRESSRERRHDRMQCLRSGPEDRVSRPWNFDGVLVSYGDNEQNLKQKWRNWGSCLSPFENVQVSSNNIHPIDWKKDVISTLCQYVYVANVLERNMNSADNCKDKDWRMAIELDLAVIYVTTSGLNQIMKYGI